MNPGHAREAAAESGFSCISTGVGPGFRQDPNGMTATIDSAGRIVIPKAVRNAAHLEPGTKVRLQVTPSGRVEIEPEPLSVALKRRGRFTVAIPTDRRPVLKQTDVDRAVAAIRAGG